MQQVTRNVRENQFAFGSILASELPLRSDEGGYSLTGRADLISEKGGVLEITDFKTGDRAATAPHRKVEFERQLLLYSHMAEQRLDRPVLRDRIYWTAEPNFERAIEYVDVDAARVAEARQQSALNGRKHSTPRFHDTEPST